LRGVEKGERSREKRRRERGESNHPYLKRYP